jgi:hypothetical protein
MGEPEPALGEILRPTLMILLGQVPVLLAYLLGIILALVMWRRYPRPALLTLMGVSLLLLVSVVTPFLSMSLTFRRAGDGGGHERIGFLLSAISLGSSLLRAAGVGLLLAAVFIGRSRPAPHGERVPESRFGAGGRPRRPEDEASGPSPHITPDRPRGS